MNEQRIQTVSSAGEGSLITDRQPAWLDRSISTLVRVNWETVAWTILLIVGAVARFYHLGARAMSHDESLHSLYGYYLYDTGNYNHDPMMHGPFRYHLTALTYFLFGDSDTTARLVPALMGMGVLWMAFQYRRYIGRIGALAAGVMLAISPSVLFHSRYIRDDIYISLFTMVWIFGAMRFLEDRKASRFGWLALMVLSMAFAFVTMENSFIHGAILGLFFAGLALWQVVRERLFLAAAPALFGVGIGFWIFEAGNTLLGIGIAGIGVVASLGILAVSIGAAGWAHLRRNDAADVAVMMATLVMPFLTPFLHLLVGWDAMAYATTLDLVHSILLVGVMTLVSVGVAFYWFFLRPQPPSDTQPPQVSFGQWAILMGSFWLIEVLFFTTFLTNTRNGLATGIVGSLGYWLAQHEVQRGNQPWYYYIMIGSLYEFLPLILSIGGISTILYWVGRNGKWDPTPRFRPASVDAVTDPHEQQWLRTHRVYFAVLMVVWTLGAWVSYTIAGEKMPWLLTHMAVPMSVLGGWWFGYMVQQLDWRGLRAKGALLLLGLTPALIFVLVVLFTNRPFAGREIGQIGDTMTWLLALLGLIGLAAGVYFVVLRAGVGASLRLAGLGFVGILLLLTIRFSYMLNYINYDMATEYLVYAHASPDVKRALAEIDLISERTVGARNVEVAYDDDTSWPLSWYMRLYPNSRFYGANPTSEAMKAPVIIVGPKNYEKVHPYVTRDYVKRTYRLVWWPDQGYFDTTWERFFSTLTDPAKMKNIFQIVFYRRYPDPNQPSGYRDLTKWPNRHEFEMYVRRDIAQQVWNLNVTPAASLVDPQEQILRERSLEIGAVRTTSGTFGDLSLLTPRAVAVGLDGTRVIADTGNHRLVWIGPDGGFVRAVGSMCRIGEGESGGCIDPDGAGPLALGDGQFNEPWGVAIDAAGNVYAADTWNGRIQVFDANGNFVRKWGYFNTTNGELGDPHALFGPRGIAIDNSGLLVVADTGNKRILQFTPEGEIVQQIGGGGLALGRFEEPTSVAVDPRDGSIFVADAWNRRIQKLDPTLVPLAEWPVSSWGSEHLYYKPYVTVAGNGDVYASDPENFRVIVYNSAGGIKTGFGSYGTEPSRFGLPNGLAWDGTTNTVVVADADNHRLLDFAVIP